MWENEVDVAADTDYTSAGHFECVLYRGQSLQRDSHALSYLNLITTLQVGVIPYITAEKRRLRVLQVTSLRSHSKYIAELRLKPSEE